MAEHELVVIRTFINRFEADVARTALEAAQIDAMVRTDDAGGMRPGLWTGNRVDLIVRQDDAERAKEILETTASASDT